MNVAVAIPATEKTTRPTKSKVDKYCVTSRLEALAPEHQRAAIKRAMRLAGIRAEAAPSLDMLRLAETPPAEDWRLVGPRTLPAPTQPQFAEVARELVATIEWRGRDERLRNQHDQIHAAMPEAIMAASAAWNALPGAKRVLANPEEVEAGQRAARWRPVLDRIGEILNTIERQIPDLWLAAISEEGLRAAAETASRLGLLTTPRKMFETPEGRRARCPMHHRRLLRRRAATARQHVAALLGTIGKGAAPYADGYAVGCWRERQEAARAFGLTREAFFADGRSIPLWDLMETSRKARIAALYAQTLGLDELAKRRQLIPVFLTMTLPPKHHPNPAHGQPYAGVDWDDAPSPGDTDAALAARWTRFRARVAAEKIELLGLRVVEPHQDGCPHLHALLYAKGEEEVEAINRHLLAICPDPPGMARVASKLVRIDRERASAASYVMKYLIKALPAAEVAAELADGVERDGDPDHLAHHAEVAAWASERKLRRFAWLGLHGIRTVWQRVRSMSADERLGAPASIRAVAASMEGGAWGDALESLGAIRSDGKPRPRLAYEEQENGYGETVKRARGICLVDWAIRLRRQECEIRPSCAPSQIPMTTVQDLGDHLLITVTVSCPRACPVEGAEAFPIIRTGPPTIVLSNIFANPV